MPEVCIRGKSPWRTLLIIYRKRTREGKKRIIPVYAVSRTSDLVAKTISEREMSDKSSRKDSCFRFFGALLQRGRRLKIKRSVHHVPHSGGYSTGVPPLPIPNREVKPGNADGTAHPRESR